MKHYIYALVDENHQPFYIGRTNNPKNRMTNHIKNAKTGMNIKVYSKIRKILKQGHSPMMNIIEECSEKEVLSKEIETIKQYKEKGINLCNLTDGGDGLLGMSKEVKQKIAETKKRNGYKHSAETKRKIGDSHRGKPLSKKHILKLSKSWEKSPEEIQLASQKISNTLKGQRTNTYRCISPDGDEYIVDSGLEEFCVKHNLNRPHLVSIANGIKGRKTHKGWKCEKIKSEEKKQFLIRDPQGEEYEVSNGITEFFREHNLKASAMYRIARGKQIQHQGWSMTTMSSSPRNVSSDP